MKLGHLWAGMFVVLSLLRLSHAQTIRFAQITDVHLFDSDGQPNKDNRAENERCLRWAVDEINRLNASGRAFDFIVFTGDFGLEKVKDDDRAAAQLRQFINRSHVTRWLLVPGNNDLDGERPWDIQHFHAFVRTLQQSSTTGKELLDFAPLSPDRPDGAILELGSCYFIGFDNSSFKSNHNPADGKAFEQAQLACVEAVETRIADATQREREKEDKKPADRRKEPSPCVFLFCHIPDYFDPYLVEVNDRRPQSWTVEPSVRTRWNTMAAGDRVKGIFAGHFHSGNTSHYQTPTWGPGLPPGVSSKVVAKTTVCPPIATKRQMDPKAQARGFLDVKIEGDCVVTVTPVWFDATTGKTAVPGPGQERSSREGEADPAADGAFAGTEEESAGQEGRATSATMMKEVNRPVEESREHRRPLLGLLLLTWLAAATIWVIVVRHGLAKEVAILVGKGAPEPANEEGQSSTKKAGWPEIDALRLKALVLLAAPLLHLFVAAAAVAVALVRAAR